ncbi:hypothetical protein [Paenibacillus planticolens]|uniref:Immunity protein 53 of polymorphic toxin system n=1 Tax=Paenibacillus planticolens TaxID=2654976 RepID=A0ABX1ZQN1_9BACL|nr:hypothetical protein [Paenibacillus planticolens]NOV01173.1 hypothetical protein [Paenibacillus planticolens]
MDYDKIKELLINRFVGWDIYYEKSGVTFWLSLNDGKLNYFEIQIVPGVGVGLTNRKNILSNDISMNSHDVAFDTFDEAVDYLDMLIQS